jgi:DNA-binding SARP family transcriptional activator
MPPDSTSQDLERPRRLLVSTVGELRIEIDGRGPLRCVGKKGPALIAFLAMRPGMSATRSRLCELLWRDAERSRSSLRQTLLVLRRTLSAQKVDVLLTEQDFVVLRSELVDCDVQHLERALVDDSLLSLEAAASIYTGPFLEGFFPGSSAFDDWASSERERVNDLAVSILDRLARRTSGEARLRFARRLLAIDPLREASYRLNMEVLAAHGDRDQALRMFETCRSVLKRELDVEPSKETRALREAILGARAEGPLRVTSGTQDPAAAHSEGRSSIVVLHFSNL